MSPQVPDPEPPPRLAAALDHLHRHGTLKDFEVLPDLPRRNATLLADAKRLLREDGIDLSTGAVPSPSDLIAAMERWREAAGTHPGAGRGRA